MGLPATMRGQKGQDKDRNSAGQANDEPRENTVPSTFGPDDTKILNQFIWSFFSEELCLKRRELNADST